MDRLQLYLGDCRQVMRQLEMESVDAIITDPPYGTNEEGKNKLNGLTRSGWTQFGEDWDKELPLDWLIDAAWVLKPGGAITVWTDTKKLGKVWEAFERVGLKPLQTLFWHKTNPAPNPRKNYASAVEGAVFGRKPGKVLCWQGGGFRHNFYESPKMAGSQKLHPTQKPIGLMEWCIEPVVPQGGMVLDPFMGSGSTGIAALNLGCSFIGIEINENYFNAARERLYKEQLRKAVKGA